MAGNEAPRRERITDLVRSYPEGNLDLIQDELLRQRTWMTTKLASTYTRATILVGAAGLLGGVNVSGAKDARLGLLLASLALYLVAAGCGVVAMRPRRGSEVNIEHLLAGTATFNRETLRKALLASNLAAHEAYERSLKRRNQWVVAGFIALTLAWTGSTLGATTDLLGPRDVQPVKMQIVEEGFE